MLIINSVTFTVNITLQSGDRAMVLCFVEFDDPKCARTAMDALHGIIVQEIMKFWTFCQLWHGHLRSFLIFSFGDRGTRKLNILGHFQPAYALYGFFVWLYSLNVNITIASSSHFFQNVHVMTIGAYELIFLQLVLKKATELASKLNVCSNLISQLSICSEICHLIGFKSCHFLQVTSLTIKNLTPLPWRSNLHIFLSVFHLMVMRNVLPVEYPMVDRRGCILT